MEQGILTPDDAAATTSALLVFESDASQLLLFVASSPGSEDAILAAPIKRLSSPSGSAMLTFERADWGPGVPFALFEDPSLDTGAVDRTKWLASFHTDRAQVPRSQSSAREALMCCAGR